MSTEATEYHSLRGHADKLHWDAVDDASASDNISDYPNPSTATATTAIHHEKEASVFPAVVVDAAIEKTDSLNHHNIKTGVDDADDGDSNNASGGGQGQAVAAAVNNFTILDHATTNNTFTANNNNNTSFLHDKIIITPRNQSPHLTLPNYDEHQKLIATQEEEEEDEELDKNNAASLLHTKQSQEQNAVNLLENTPIRWDPPSDYFNNDAGVDNAAETGGSGGGSSSENTDGMVGSTSSSSSSSSPRGPEGSDGIESSTSSEESSKYCKSQNGVFGSPRNGGVLLQYQYELTLDKRLGEEWIDDILPNLEGGISDSLLPVLFEGECIPSEDVRRRRRGERGLSSSSSLGDGSPDVVSSRGYLRGLGGKESRRLKKSSSGRNNSRRLEVIVGIDSDPRDFPARDKECQFTIPYEKSTCYVMEGALTVHFPPDYSVFTYVQGAQFSTLNTIRDGMAYGHLAETHPSILGLKLLDSSYSLAPFITPELQEAIVNQREKRNANIAAAILVPLFVLCCCGCCLFLWKRRPNDVDDLHDMLDDMFLPFVKSKMKSMDHGSDGRERDTLHNPIKHANNNNNSNHYKNSKRRSRQGTVNSSRRSGSHSASADAYLAENGGVRITSEDGGLDTSARRRAKSRKDKKEKSKKKKKKKSKKKRSKHRSRSVNFDSTDTDNTDTDDNTAGRGTSSSSTDDNNSTTSSGSRSSRSSTTSSDRRSTTEGTSTSDDDRETTSTSTSDDDKETTTSTSTSDGDKSSSSGDSEKDDDFDINSMTSSHSNFMLQRRNLRRRSKGRNLGPTTRSKPKSNLVIAGGTGEDDNSVMTGMTGATGTHSMASAATAQAKNVVSGGQRTPINVGGGDDTSVMTGIMSAATNRVANTTTSGAGGDPGLLGEVTDDEEAELDDMTDVGMGTGQSRPPSPNTFSYIPKSSIGGGAKFDD